MKMLLLRNRTDHVTGIAWVDADVHKVVSGFKWRSNPSGYVMGRVDGREVMLHREIMGLSGSFPLVDHIDGDPRNNLRSNLRVATGSQNTANRHVIASSCGYRGVTFHKSSGKWQAAIKVERKSIFLGLHSCIEDAARAYDLAAIEHFGEFAIPNFKSGAA